MEYLGAKIDIDISQFVTKVDKAIDKTEELAKTSDEEFKKIAESMRNNLENVGKVDMSDTISSFKKDFDDLDTYLKSKKIELPDFGAKAELSKLENNLSSFYINEEGALKRVSRALDEYMKNDMTLKERLGFGGFKGLLEMYKDGNMSAKEFLDTVDKVQKKFKGTNTRENGGTEESARAEKLSRALKELKRNKEFLSKVNESSVSPTDDSGAGDAVEKTGKKLSTFGKLVTRVAGHLIPRNFRYMFTAIRGAIGSTGVGALILAVIGYIKMLYEWNKKLIGLKLGDMKDRLKVATGYMKEEDALTASIKRRTDAIKEQTQALTDNVKAQRDAASPLAKAQAIQQRNMAVNETFKNIVGDREFHFFGGAKAKDIQDVLDMVSGDANKKAVKRYFDIMSNDEEVEKMSQKQLDDMQFELEKALQLSDKQKEVNKALDEWNKVAGLEEDAYGAIALQQTDAKNNLEKANKAYDETLKYYEEIEKKRKRIENTMSSQTLNYELGERKASMNNLGLKEIGGTDWARLQSSIDSIETASKMRNDNRGWTLSEYDRLLDKKKKNIEMSGKEDTQTRKLSAEIDTLTAKINYLNNNGVKSRTQRLMTETLELEKQQKIIERENAKYKEQETALEHILGIERKRAEIKGMAGYDLGNLDMEIETIDKKIGGLRGQRNISAEEMRQLDNLELEKAVKLKERDLLAERKQREESERRTTAEKTRLQIAKEQNGLKKNRNGRTDSEIEREDLRLTLQERLAEQKQAQDNVDILKARKQAVEECADAEKEGKHWTEEDAKALEDANQQLALAESATEAAKDALENYTDSEKEAIDVHRQHASVLGEVADGLAGIADEMEGNLGDNPFSKIAGGLSEVAGAFSKMQEWEANGGMTAQDKAGAIMQAAQFAAGQATGIIAAQRRIKESADEWKESVADVAHEYTMIKLDDLEYKQRNMFGVEDPYKKLQDNAKKYSEASKATREALERLSDEGTIKVGQKVKADMASAASDALKGAAVGAMAGSMAGPWGTAIGAAAGAVGGFVTGIFKSKEMVDVFDNLKTKFGEVFDPDTLEINKEILASYDQLDEKTKKLVDNYKELKEKMDEAKEEFKEYAKELFGDVGNELSDILADAFRNDRLFESVNDFRDYVKKQMESIISSKIYSAVFGNMFDGLKAKVDEAFENYSRTGGNIDFIGLLGELPYKTEQLVGTYGTLMKQVQDSMSDWDMFAPDKMSQDALRGTIAGMSEDTAGKINGNFMGLKLSAMEINAKMTGVRDMMEDNQAILGRSLSVLQQIAGNTAYLLRIDERLNEMQINGIKVV